MVGCHGGGAPDASKRSGLAFAPLRVYQPELGMFLTHDPARQFASPYAYGPWDPVNGTDPTGAVFGLETLIAWAVVLLAAVAIDVGVRTGDVGAALQAGALTFVSGVATAVGAYAGLGVLAAHVSPSTMAIVNNVLAVAGLASGAYGAVEAARNGMYASAAVGALLLAAGAYRLLSGSKTSTAKAGSVAGQQFADSREGVVLNDASSSRDDRDSSFLEYLKVRPPNDDGYLTLGEAKWQWKYGGGEPVVVDAQKIEFDPLKAESFHDRRLLATPRFLRDRAVHGTVTFELSSSGTTARIMPDTFNFDMKPWRSFDLIIRNLQTIGLRLYVGPGREFQIIFRGEVPVVY
ncbi:MAG: hypothetical protein KatS3mg077_2895 [Candidatus Binatia bacterium]|nr:MAG: hypothetical protein KatS3mg077_2895 [Candidatus Binatia bacterium]